jgi:hypothetical protein
MSKKTSYIVLRFDENFVVLSPFGSISRRLGANEAETMIARSAITTITKRGGALHINTTGGQEYEILFGLKRAQADLTRAAFGLPSR